jgi:bacteriorhodopsin
VTLTIGMVCFGVMIGFITYRTLVRTTDNASINDLAAVIAAVGGGAVTAIVRPQTNFFGWYAIGLLAGFVLYGVFFAWLNRDTGEFAKVMGQSREAAEKAATRRAAGPNAPLRRR